MRKEELIKQLQEHEPLLANAVSHMVEYIQDRYPAAYPSRTANIAVSLRRTSLLPLSVYWIVVSLTDCKTYLTILRMIGSIICRREDMECTADFLFWLQKTQKSCSQNKHDSSPCQDTKANQKICESISDFAT